MAPLAVYTETYGEYAYSVCKEDDGKYFLVINEEPYCEDGTVFRGSFSEVAAKLEELKVARA